MTDDYLPTRITRAQLLAALDVLGIPHTDVRSVDLGLREVTIRQVVKSESRVNGKRGRVERVTTIPVSVLRTSKETP